MRHHIASIDGASRAKIMADVKIAIYHSNPAYQGKRIAEVEQELDQEAKSMPLLQALNLVTSNREAKVH